jgi:hypothetical protein
MAVEICGSCGQENPEGFRFCGRRERVALRDQCPLICEGLAQPTPTKRTVGKWRRTHSLCGEFVRNVAPQQRTLPRVPAQGELPRVRAQGDQAGFSFVARLDVSRRLCLPFASIT